MRLIVPPLAKALNKAYLKQNIKRVQVELLKANLVRPFERMRTDEKIALVEGKK